jgi:hypothetical protein
LLAAARVEGDRAQDAGLGRVEAEFYFSAHRDAARVAALFQFGAAVPLALYAATASARLHNLGIRAPGATIALAGGLLSAGFLGISALVSWVLSRPEVTASPALVRAFQDFGYVAGGPGHVVFLGIWWPGGRRTARSPRSCSCPRAR